MASYSSRTQGSDTASAASSSGRVMPDAPLTSIPLCRKLRDGKTGMATNGPPARWVSR